MTSFIRPGLLLSLVLIYPASSLSTRGSTPSPEDSGSNLEARASITATPNPVPAGEGVGVTRISWHTGNNRDGQVFVSENGTAEKLFARGSDGSSDAQWIGNGSTYVFRLYSVNPSKELLALVEVKGTSEVAKTIDFTSLISRAITLRTLPRRYFS